MDHPNVVKVFEFAQDDKYYYMVMEYWEGGELLDLILSNQAINEEWILMIVK